jgi:hypothetical protein
MSVRLGIELSPAACRIVELDTSHRFGRDGSDTCVRSFARLPREGIETHRRLSSFRRPSAAAVVWGLQADHRQVVVEHGSFRVMRREAVTVIRNAGVETQGRVADLAPARRRARGAATCPVVVALAPTHALATSLRWLTGQGVRVDSIVTPALALMSLARLRRGSTASGAADAYVALEETATAVALMRDGALVAACELEWGFQDARGHTRPHDEIATRLAADVERFLVASGESTNAVAQVCLCGGLPELRSMAVRLMEQLDVEVETLDSLFAIDAARLPEPAHEFRDHSAELRLAWAAAADWPAPINLLRERQRRLAKTMLTRAAVVAGVATGVVVAWRIQGVLQSPASTPPTSSPQAAAPLVLPPRPPPIVLREARQPRPQPPPPQPPPLAVKAPVAALDPPPPLARAPQPAPALPSDGVLAPPLPFDAVLGTILYAPERQLAIIDGRIVQVGDDVRGATVVDIVPTAVTLRDGQGRLRRLALGALGR